MSDLLFGDGFILVIVCAPAVDDVYRGDTVLIVGRRGELIYLRDLVFPRDEEALDYERSALRVYLVLTDKRVSCSYCGADNKDGQQDPGVDLQSRVSLRVRDDKQDERGQRCSTKQSRVVNALPVNAKAENNVLRFFD